MRLLIPIFVLLSFLNATHAYAFQFSDFESPESAVRDPETGAIFISNMNGDPFAKDGNGYISRVNASGTTLIQKFIGGRPNAEILNAPKGLAIWTNQLIVTDLDKIHFFDKKSGKPIRVLDLSFLGATFLNDAVVSASGTLYVSDMLANKIFSLDLPSGSQPAIFKQGAVLAGPNGLAINPRSNNLLVVTWVSGAILEIDKEGRIHILKRGLHNLDGIDFDDQWNLYVSSYSKGEIYRVTFLGRGSLSVYMSDLQEPADISFDRRKRELIVPTTGSGTVQSFAQGSYSGTAKAV